MCIAYNNSLDGLLVNVLCLYTLILISENRQRRPAYTIDLYGIASDIVWLVFGAS